MNIGVNLKLSTLNVGNTGYTEPEDEMLSITVRLTDAQIKALIYLTPQDFHARIRA
jgi:hypothetical protein